MREEDDRLLGVVIAVAGALLLALRQQLGSLDPGQPVATWATVVAVLAAVFGVLMGLLGFVTRSFIEVPAATRLVDYASLPPAEMRWRALPALLEGIKLDERLHRRKRLGLSLAVIGLAVATMAEAVALLFHLVSQPFGQALALMVRLLGGP